MYIIHHPVLGSNRLLAPSPFGATQNPADCEQHSWLQRFFFLPHHWQHCLAVVTKVNTQNGKFLLFDNLYWSPHTVFVGLTCRMALLASHGLVRFKEQSPQPWTLTPLKKKSLFKFDTMKPWKSQNWEVPFRFHSS